jgi:dTDP-4-amino-4,6-dideoxygalactose transaminase
MTPLAPVVLPSTEPAARSAPSQGDLETAEAAAARRPLRSDFLPFCLPEIGEEEVEEVVKTLRSGWITTGPRTKEFEHLFAQYVGARYAIAVSSCTAALHVALAALGVGPGDEVITSPLTFCSTANVVIHLGATPVFADIGADYNIDPAGIEHHITSNTKAIIPVHHSGQPCRMDEILACANRHGLPVVEDAAHAAGAAYRGRAIGTIGTATAFSFYAIKNMTTAEGGMITTDDEQLAQKMQIYSLHGISKDAWKRYTSTGSWYYEVLYPGFKCNMTDIQASLGIHQLAKLDQFLATRCRYVQMYEEAFAPLAEIQRPLVWPDVKHAWHLYMIQLELDHLDIDRAQFIEELRAENIGTSVHFIPVHLHPYYRDRYGYARGDYPNAERTFDRIVSLPLYPKMTEGDVTDVIAAVKKVVAHTRKRVFAWPLSAS